MPTLSTTGRELTTFKISMVAHFLSLKPLPHILSLHFLIKGSLPMIPVGPV